MLQGNVERALKNDIECENASDDSVFQQDGAPWNFYYFPSTIPKEVKQEFEYIIYFC